MNIRKIKGTGIKPYTESLDQVKKLISERDKFTVDIVDSTTFCYIPTDKELNWFGGSVWEMYSPEIVTGVAILKELEKAFKEERCTDEDITVKPGILDTQFFDDANQEIMDCLKIPVSEPHYSEIYNWCKQNSWDKGDTAREFKKLKLPKDNKILPK